PGNLHLINGLYDCHRSRVPVLAIAAHIPSAEIGTGYFQETDPAHLFKECSHYVGTVSSAENLPRILKIAIETAINKRGVAVLVMAGDVATSALDAAVQAFSLEAQSSYLRPSDAKVAELKGALEKAKKVTILAGAGCEGAHAELLEVARRLKAPIVHALRGKEHVEYANPFDVGLTGLLGFSSGYHAMEACDLLLMLGTDFPYTQFYPKAFTAQVDARGENIGRRTKVDLGVVGDVRETLKLLLADLAENKETKHLEKALKHYHDTRASFDKEAVPGKIRGAVHPQYVVKALSDIASADAVFTCDVGTPTVWAARYLKLNGQRRLLGSFNHGSMANALPQAIGAQATYPKRQVFSLSGDGGFAMLMGDILTLNQHALPVKTIIFNNSSLAFVELEMKAAGYLETATDLKNPNFAKLAEAAGIVGIRVENPEELIPALERAIAEPGPVVIDVLVPRMELSIPPTISLEQVKGFGVFATKAVMGGLGGELIDLAKTNLWR
ncbi:MAG: ubiquinone-dependent pyruvate dehydrogenase, partial [Proteobacteria bacterium]